MELTVDEGGVKKPLSEKVEDAVDLRPCRGRQGPGLPAALVGAGKKGRGGRHLLLLLLLGCFGWLTTTTLQCVGWGGVETDRLEAGPAEVMN